MDAQRFFEKAFPQMVVEHFEAFLQRQGTISFAIEGKGHWTIRLGDPATPVMPGFQRNADLRLWWTEDAFLQFLEGRLDIQKAIRTEELTAVGNAELFESLGYILRPQTTLLDVLMQQ